MDIQQKRQLVILVGIVGAALIVIGLWIGFASVESDKPFGRNCGSAFSPDSTTTSCKEAREGRTPLALGFIAGGAVVIAASVITRPRVTD